MYTVVEKKAPEWAVVAADQRAGDAVVPATAASRTYLYSVRMDGLCVGKKLIVVHVCVQIYNNLKLYPSLLPLQLVFHENFRKGKTNP